VSRHRLNVFLEREHAKRLDELAVMKGLSKSSVVAAALASFLSPDDGHQREAAIAKRLDQLTRQFDRLERDQTILIETVALFVRTFLTVSTPIPEAHQPAARAQGRVRFEQFIEQLGRHLQHDRRFARELHASFVPNASQFFAPEKTEPVSAQEPHG
jgi:hypothetical protein